jgi:hypothetical protein
LNIILSTAFSFYSCHEELRQTPWLKQYTLIISRFCLSESNSALTSYNVTAGLHAFLEALGEVLPPGSSRLLLRLLPVVVGLNADSLMTVSWGHSNLLEVAMVHGHLLPSRRQKWRNEFPLCPEFSSSISSFWFTFIILPFLTRLGP